MLHVSLGWRARESCTAHTLGTQKPHPPSKGGRRARRPSLLGGRSGIGAAVPARTGGFPQGPPLGRDPSVQLRGLEHADEHGGHTRPLCQVEEDTVGSVRGPRTVPRAQRAQRASRVLRDRSIDSALARPEPEKSLSKPSVTCGKLPVLGMRRSWSRYRNMLINAHGTWSRCHASGRCAYPRNTPLFVLWSCLQLRILLLLLSAACVLLACLAQGGDRASWSTSCSGMMPQACTTSQAAWRCASETCREWPE